MKAEFEEKQYETPMNIELSMASSHLWAPGQVLENLLGFDAAMYARNPAYWALWNLATPTPLPLHPLWHPSQSSSLPADAVANLFIQYKRPEMILSARAAEYQHWRTRYFRFHIDDPPGQAQRLSDLARHLGSTGRVVYAAPTFITCRALWDAQETAALISESVFFDAQAVDPTQHARISYTQAGTKALLHSEPTELDLFDLRAWIAGVDSAPLSASENQFTVISSLKDVFNKVFLRDIQIRKLFNSRVQRIVRFADGLTPELGTRFQKRRAVIEGWVAGATFADVLGLSWAIMFRG